MREYLENLCIKTNKEISQKEFFDGKHSMPYINLGICCDSRKYECPYALHVNIDNDFMNFNGTICGYKIKKEEAKSGDYDHSLQTMIKHFEEE